MTNTDPVLYSFRRCPYAIRARMALYKSGQSVELREVDLKDKPGEMLEASPKGTVPVLVLPGGKVLEESLDIMRWALNQNDPDLWLTADPETTDFLITRNDTDFKAALDRYKYPDRFPDEDTSGARDTCLEIMQDLDGRLAEQRYFMGMKLSLADIAIFPFIRQCAFTDRPWFDAQDLSRLQQWCAELLESRVFKGVMGKFAPWRPGDTPVYMAPFNPRH